VSLLKRFAGFLTFGLAIADSACILFAYAAAIYMADMPQPNFHAKFVGNLAYFVVFVLVWCGAAADQRLFVSRRDDSLTQQFISIVKAVASALIFTGFVIGFFTRRIPDRDFFVFFGAFALLIMSVFRVAIRLTLWDLRRRGFNYRQILIIGANERSERLCEIIQTHGQYGYHIAGFLEDDPERLPLLQKYQVAHLGPFSDLERVLANRVIDEVYITLTVRSFYEMIQRCAHLCEGVGVMVRMTADLFPLRIATSRVSLLEDIPIISLCAVPDQQFQLFLKRALDFVASTLALIVLLPLVFLPTAILIKLESLIWPATQGPVFFTQVRVGLNGRRFKMVKFRSMVKNAEELRKELEHLNEADGPVFKIRKDPRVTRIGKLIRKTSVDELPQLLNVWVGHMSLVGPRPPLPSEVEQYSWDQRRRLSVKPGMTGLWQISGRSNLTFREWVDLDLAYIDTWSVAQDFRIIFKTVQVVVQGKGAA
jgi:exopolysaccharide biosynthesis polyprenyl glycosylphosphotransferase